MTLLSRLLNRLRPPVDVAESIADGEKLIERVDLTIEARCPCGSKIAHLLTLHSHADCPRCGRTFAIRSLQYFRRSPDQLPDMHVTIGFVVTHETLKKARPAGGVH